MQMGSGDFISQLQRPKFLQPHFAALVLLISLSVLANAPALSGFFNTDPTLQLSDLGVGLSGGWILAPPGWLDPSVGYITQPLGYLAAEDWLHGIVPWWNPYSGIGMPLAAEMQTSSFFLPFILLLHFSSGWILLRVLLQALCGVFTYLLLIELKLLRLSAFLGGILFALTPQFFLSPSAPIDPLPFLPLLILGIEKAANAAASAKAMGWSVIVIACTYSFYAGNPEVAYLNGLLATVWAIRRLFSLSRNTRLAFLKKLLSAVGLSLCLCAPLLIPFLSYLHVSYIGLHSALFRQVRLTSHFMGLQLVPYLYGLFGTLPPLQLRNLIISFDYTRIPGWVGMPVLCLALAAFWRRECHASLRLVLLLWIVSWEARYLGLAPAMWVFNIIPGIAITDATRYSGAAVNFAVFILASLGFNDYLTAPPIAFRRLFGTLLSVLAVFLGAIAPNIGFIRTLYHLNPQSGYIAFVSIICAFFVVAALCVELRYPRYRRSLVAALVLGPFITFALPQFAGLRAGHIDLAPIQFLQKNIGDKRAMSLGPLGLNFPSQYGIASINYSALPVPSLWSHYVAEQLSPTADLNTYDGGAAGQSSAFLQHMPAYAALGVGYIIVPPKQSLIHGDYKIANAKKLETPFPLMPHGSDLSGIVAGDLPFQSIEAVSVFVGTYLGRASGPVTATLCSQGICVHSTVDAATAADNHPLLFQFDKPLRLTGAAIIYRFSHPAGEPIAIWSGPSLIGDGTQPTIDFIAARQPDLPKLVFQDASAAIFQMAASSPYAGLDNPACQATTIDRLNFETNCSESATFTRRELFFPGWSVLVNGKPATLSKAGIFQAVSLPAGRNRVRFYYRPPYTAYSCAIALFALGVWIFLVFRRRGPAAPIKKPPAGLA